MFVYLIIKFINYVVFKQVGNIYSVSNINRTIGMKIGKNCRSPQSIKECPIEYTMKIIGGKWKPIILFRIHVSINRFGNLSRQITGISKNMLTKQLRELERDKIINRKIYAEIPPRVEYTLTKKGESIIPILENLCEWGMKNNTIKQKTSIKEAF